MSVLNQIKRVVNTKMVVIKKYEPEILIVTGVVGVMTSFVMACKATTKATKVTEGMKADIVDIEEDSMDIEPDTEEYKSEVAPKKFHVYKEVTKEYVKLYAPSVALCTVSLGCIICSHDIMKKRNVALAAAYASVDRGFKKYRNAVAERYGEDIEREILYGFNSSDKEEIVNEDGTIVEPEKKPIESCSPYTTFFDPASPEWEDSSEYNFSFLRLKQNYWNEKLQIDKVVFMNDVLKSLGLPPTKEGQIIGWAYDPTRTNIHNYIDFGIFDISKNDIMRFNLGAENVVLLEFNVDGSVWELL